MRYRQRLDKNANRICYQCGKRYYRRGTKESLYCGRECFYAAIRVDRPAVNHSPPPAGYLGTQLLGDLVGYSCTHLSRLARRGDVLAEKRGFRWYISQDDLNRYMEDLRRFGRKDCRGRIPETWVDNIIRPVFGVPAQERKKAA